MILGQPFFPKFIQLTILLHISSFKLGVDFQVVYQYDYLLGTKWLQFLSVGVVTPRNTRVP